MRRVLLAAIVVAVGLLAMATTGLSPATARPVPIGTQVELAYGLSADHPWLTDAGNRQRTGASPFRVPSEPPRRVFEFGVGAGRLWAPSLSREGLCLVATGAGLIGVDLGGRRRFALPLGLASGTPSITPEGDTVSVVRGADLARVSAAGELIVEREVAGGLLGSPLVLDDGSIVVVDRSGRLMRLDERFEPLRVHALDLRVALEPALTPSGEVLVAAGPWLRRFDATLEPGPSALLASAIVAGPVVAADGSAWVITADAELVALDPALTVRFRTSLSTQRLVAPALAVAADGSVRVSSLNTGLQAFSAAGEPLFALPDLHLARGITVDADGIVVAVDETRQLLAVRADGTVLWSVAVGMLTWAAPVLGRDSTLYLVGRSGSFAAWR